MDDVIRKEYEILYEESFPQEAFAAWFILENTPREQVSWKESLAREFAEYSTLIKDTINELDKAPPWRQEISLRPDAKYFLLLNLVQMVAVPLRFTDRVEREVLRSMLREDVKTLVLMSRQTTTNRGKNEITAHAVIDAIAHSWRQLNLARFKLWED